MPNKYTKIGDLLAAARQEQKKSIKEVSDGTKIMAKYLEAVEKGDPAQLPSTPYFLLFARSYAQFLGIDPAILEEIEAINGDKITFDADVDEVTELDDAERPVSTSKPNKSFIKTLAYTIGVIVVLFGAFLFYNLFILDKPDDLPGEMIESAPPVGEIDPDTAELSEITIIPYKPPEKLDLHLRARQDVWVVVARDGDTVINRQLTAGDERHWQADYRFVLTVGISTAVELTLNGTKLAPLADRAQTIAGLEINQVNYRDFYPDENIEDELTPSREIPVRPRFGATDQPAVADTTEKDTSDGN